MAASPLWEITDHLCRACFGRILKRATADGQTIFRCSNCGIERETRKGMCWCHGRFRCQLNTNKTPDFPGEIEVVEVH